MPSSRGANHRAITTPESGTPADSTQPFSAHKITNTTNELLAPNARFASAEISMAPAKKRRTLARSAMKPFTVLPTA